MTTVLILDCEFSAGIESMQSLGRFGCRLHVAASSLHGVAFRSRYAHVKLQQPAAAADFIPWLIELDRQHSYSLIIPSTEVSLSLFSDPRIPSELRRKAILPPVASLQLGLNKEEVLRRALSLGIPVPASVVACGSLPETPLEFPIVAKPVYSKERVGEEIVEHKVSYFHDAAKLQEFLQKYPTSAFQLQQRVSGRGLGVELLFVEGEPVWTFAHERLHEVPLTGGASTYRRSIEPPQLILEHSVALLRSMQWHGVAMVEWKVASNGAFFLMEINPRLWGSLALAIDAGVDFPRGLLAVAQGNLPASQPPWRRGYFTRNIISDLRWQITNFTADHSNPDLLTQSRVTALLELLRPLTGRESWDYFDWRDLGVTLGGFKSFLGSSAKGAGRKLRRRVEMARALRGPHRRILERLRKKPSTRLLFLCYGNICRSPVAELVCSKLLPGTTVQSAGFHERTGRSSPAKMMFATAALDIDLASHRSRLVTAEMVKGADLILVMDRKNHQQLFDRFPEAAGKVTYLGLFASQPKLEIPDPYDMPQDMVEGVVRTIEQATHNLAHSISPSTVSTPVE